jgi:hypothetical protein
MPRGWHTTPPHAPVTFTHLLTTTDWWEAYKLIEQERAANPDAPATSRPRSMPYVPAADERFLD